MEKQETPLTFSHSLPFFWIVPFPCPIQLAFSLFSRLSPEDGEKIKVS
jgi:hypothetical protein